MRKPNPQDMARSPEQAALGLGGGEMGWDNVIWQVEKRRIPGLKKQLI